MQAANTTPQGLNLDIHDRSVNIGQRPRTVCLSKNHLTNLMMKSSAEKIRIKNKFHLVIVKKNKPFKI